jgi:hypothetical protein
MKYKVSLTKSNADLLMMVMSAIAAVVTYIAALPDPTITYSVIVAAGVTFVTALLNVNKNATPDKIEVV